ncbi:hypothetical protein GQ55_2G138900 [Panicum hallii var. hallii]|uniref:Uncharacterized protein n=1 Tax=Panicum hallii var. hallii TaxID=1504633 RepID=A0A2T7EPM9_9POAL|nr:hypothetical protein GQ55_2G138900 [Panicum hallii var. hallii]
MVYQKSMKSRHRRLPYESMLYMLLQGGMVCNGKGVNVTVIDLLDRSLEELFNFCNRNVLF